MPIKGECNATYSHRPNQICLHRLKYTRNPFYAYRNLILYLTVAQTSVWTLNIEHIRRGFPRYTLFHIFYSISLGYKNLLVIYRRCRQKINPQKLHNAIIAMNIFIFWMECQRILIRKIRRLDWNSKILFYFNHIYEDIHGIFLIDLHFIIIYVFVSCEWALNKIKAPNQFESRNEIVFSVACHGCRLFVHNHHVKHYSIYFIRNIETC